MQEIKFLNNQNSNKMAIQIRTTETTKVVERNMFIGATSENDWYAIAFKNTTDTEKRTIYVESDILRSGGYKPKINKTEIGWGCHSVKPSVFRRVLRELKKVEKFTEDLAAQDCEFKVISLKTTVKIPGQNLS